MTIAAVNALTRADFIVEFGEIAEHSAWVAEMAETARPFENRDSMITAFANAMRGAQSSQQLALIKAHPDLAGKAAIAGELTDDSTKEQAGAGLASLTADEFERFTELNGQYRTKFGFPFIFAVKGATKDMILDAFADRVDNGQEDEFEMALTQIARILRFRLEDRVSDESATQQ